MQKEIQYLGFIIGEDVIMAGQGQGQGNETNATTHMCKRGKKFHCYVQPLQETYSKFLCNCKTYH